MTLSNLPAKKISITIRNNAYDVTYPNVQQLIDIDSLKLSLSLNRYDALKFTLDAGMQENALRIDIIATFTILIPKLANDITTDKRNLGSLDIEQFAEVKDAYLNQFLPWFTEWNTALSAPKETPAE